jgi:hypothetical protein
MQNIEKIFKLPSKRKLREWVREKFGYSQKNDSYHEKYSRPLIDPPMIPLLAYYRRYLFRGF